MAVVWTLLLLMCGILHTGTGIPLSDFYSFGANEKDFTVGPTVDGNNYTILDQGFPFFDEQYDLIYINNNGIISFNSSFSDFLPRDFPLDSNISIIAPFWADSETLISGTVWFGIRSNDLSLLERARQDVRRYFTRLQNFEPNFLFVSTWERVPHFVLGTKTNTYQCVLVSDGDSSFAFFHYADGMIEWTTGDETGFNGLGGREAEIGYDAGDGVNYHSIFLSGTPEVLNIASTSNVGIGGVWAFRLDQEDEPVVTCSEKTPVAIGPLHGSMLGGTAIFMHFCQGIGTETIKCSFGGVETQGVKVNDTRVVCVSPFLQRSGLIPLEIKFESRETIKARFLSLSPENSHTAILEDVDSLLFKPHDEVTVKWTPDSIIKSDIETNFRVNVEIYALQYRRATSNYFELEEVQVVKNIDNDGEEKITLQHKPRLRCSSLDSNVKFGICSIIFKVSVSETSSLPASIGIWTGIAFFIPSLETFDRILGHQCEAWATGGKNQANLPQLRTLTPCPPTLPLAIFDINFQRESMVSDITRDATYQNDFMTFFHKGHVCYRQSIPLADGPGQQCCYREDNALVKKYSGGSADSVSPLNNYYRHVLGDLMPYAICCKGEYNICDRYFEARPEGDENGYRLPIPACIYGDPHIVTLDGHKYTFNGKGEFILVQTSTNIFTLQGRMEQALDPQGTPSPGTVFTAIVAKQISTNTSIQFEVGAGTDEGSLVVLVDGKREEFEGLSLQEFEDVILIDKGNETVQALFSSGANVEISVLNGIINVMLVALPSSMKQTTTGLMGSYNDIISDDLKPRSGGQALLLEESLENIHYKFGITWIINNESESLFTYSPESSWNSYYSPSFVPMFAPTFNDTNLQKEAKDICGEDTFCLFDIAATKRVEIGAATMEGQETLDTIMEMSKPIICSPKCENGVCLENNTCSCSDGYQGNRCSEPILKECSFNPCQNNGTCIKQSVVLLCDCPSEFSGSFCQRKVPPFQIQLVNGSPRVSGGSVEIEFLPTKSALSKCALDGRALDCSKGFVRYYNVTPGPHNFRIVALTSSGERAVTRRRIFIGPCALHIINDGVTINEKDVAIEFFASGDVPSVRCKIDGQPFRSNCDSPLRFKDLAPGEHRVVLRPEKCEGTTAAGSLSMKFEI